MPPEPASVSEHAFATHGRARLLAARSRFLRAQSRSRRERSALEVARSRELLAGSIAGLDGLDGLGAVFALGDDGELEDVRPALASVPPVD